MLVKLSTRRVAPFTTQAADACRSAAIYKNSPIISGSFFLLPVSYVQHAGRYLVFDPRVQVSHRHTLPQPDDPVASVRVEVLCQIGVGDGLEDFVEHGAADGPADCATNEIVPAAF